MCRRSGRKRTGGHTRRSSASSTTRASSCRRVRETSCSTCRPLVDQLAARIGLDEAQIEERLGPDAGRITIMESDQLGTVQTAVELIRKLSIFLAIVILALFAVAVYLARGPASRDTAGGGHHVHRRWGAAARHSQPCRGLDRGHARRGSSLCVTLRRTRGSSAPTCCLGLRGPPSPTARSSSSQPCSPGPPVGRCPSGGGWHRPSATARARLRGRWRSLSARRRLGPDPRVQATVVDPRLRRVDRARRRGVPAADGPESPAATSPAP